jgi:hypothetical protein
MRPSFAAIARIAGRQHGRVSRDQLLEAGVNGDRIKRWRADGLLHAVHVGVYAVGHTAPALLADLMAAVLAGGVGAVVSHWSAGHALRILALRPRRPHITVPTTAGNKRAGIVVHRVKALDPADTMLLHGVAMTTVARVLLDLAPRLSETEVSRACHEAWVRYSGAAQGDSVAYGVLALVITGSLIVGRTGLPNSWGANALASDLDVARTRVRVANV